MTSLAEALDTCSLPRDDSKFPLRGLRRHRGLSVEANLLNGDGALFLIFDLIVHFAVLILSIYAAALLDCLALCFRFSA